MPKYHATIAVQNGEYKHIHHVLLEKGSSGRANVYASQFYSDRSYIEEQTYFFHRGEVATTVANCTAISDEEFAVLRKFISTF